MQQSIFVDVGHSSTKLVIGWTNLILPCININRRWLSFRSWANLQYQWNVRNSLNYLNQSDSKKIIAQMNIPTLISKYHRICLSKSRWNENRNNCSCLPQCNSVDYSFTQSLDHRSIGFNAESFISTRRLKRDVKFSIHYLIGNFHFLSSYKLAWL